MKLEEIYRLAVAVGIEKDPRGKAGVEKELKKQKQKYEECGEKEKEIFDKELFLNPYGDTRLLYGDGNTEIKGLFAGVDMETPELVLADRLREKGKKIDLVLAHHPEGIGMPGLGNVMNMQAQIFAEEGIPINVAEGVMAPRVTEVRQGLMAGNFQRAVDAARLLDIPFMSVHTPADNLVQDYVGRFLDEKAPETVGDIVDALLEIPEYKEAAKKMDPPTILVGKKSNSCGRILIEFTGGTGTSKDIYKEMAARGIGTVIGMHMREACRKEAEKYHINVVIAGHMASDSIGINLFLDRLSQNGVEIIAGSGLIRVER